MKKIFTLLGAALVALSANAANWYISGQFQGWKHANPDYKFTETSSGVFSININKEDFAGEFLICQGEDNKPDWNNKIGGVTNMVADKEYTYTPGGDNFSVSGTINVTTIEFNTNNKTIKINGTAGVNDYSVVYLIGDFGDSWNESRTDYPLNPKAGSSTVFEGTYTLTAANNYFKMKAGNYVYGTGGDDVTVEMGKQYTASQSGNAFVLGPGEYTFTYNLEKNASTGTLTVTGDGKVPETDYSSWWVNVLGDFNQWTDNGVNPVNGISTTPNLAIGTTGFKIKVYNGEDVYYNYGEEAIPVNTWVTLNQDLYNGPAVQIQGAKDDSVYTVKFNCATNQVYVESDDTPVIYPENLYIIGNVAPNYVFNPTMGTLMTAQGDGVFEINNIEIKDTENPEENAYFGFATQLLDSEDWTAFDAYRYGPSENNTEVTTGNSYGVVKVGYNSYMIAPGSYKVTVDLSTMKMSVAEPTVGVESIEAAENGNVKFYNFQGVEVSNPAPGMYIKVVDNKATKVIVK